MPWQWIVAGTLSGAMAYRQFREGICLASGDALKVYESLTTVFTKSISTPVPPSAQPPQQSTTTMLILGSHMSRVQTLFSAAGIIVEVYKTFQADQIAQELRGIANKITISNNIQVQGSGGADGFATHVRDFIDLKTDQYAKDGRNHRFLVYHPDTQWHGAFRRLLQDRGPLDESFCGITNDLFALCRWMLCMRVELQEQGQGQDKPNQVQFHVLIPAYQTLVIPRPFVLHRALFPLTFEGEVANGEPLVWLNFPLEGKTTLRDIGTIYKPPREGGWEKYAAVTSTFVGVHGVGTSAAMGAAAATVACPPLACALFFTIGMGSIFGALGAVGEVEKLWDSGPAWALLG